MNIFIRTNDDKLINITNCKTLRIKENNNALYADDYYIKTYKSHEDAVIALDSLTRQLKNCMHAIVLKPISDDLDEVK